jgi:hypothetical protein
MPIINGTFVIMGTSGIAMGTIITWPVTAEAITNDPIWFGLSF